MIGIYLHIPYCKTLCPYCDFVKARARGVPQGFVDAICNEIAAFDGPSEAGSIFFGGGTPSLMTPQQLEQMLRALSSRFSLRDAEISIEVNPDDITSELVQSWRAVGINRVSLGVQSFDDPTLRYLGRRHNADSALRACETVTATFDNWNLDLIFGARQFSKSPPLTSSGIVDAWAKTLEQTLRLKPPHVAAYGLTYEADTPFEKRQHEAIDDELSLELYQMAEQSLTAYEHYEVSNYALAGYESRHNLIYWHNESYAGFGPGAYAFINGVRSRNHADVNRYVAAPGEKEESLQLPVEEIQIETLIQHFRLRTGLQESYFKDRFHQNLDSTFREPLASLLSRGLLERQPGVLRPTPRGFYLNNEIGLALVR